MLNSIISPNTFDNFDSNEKEKVKKKEPAVVKQKFMYNKIDAGANASREAKSIHSYLDKLRLNQVNIKESIKS